MLKPALIFFPTLRTNLEVEFWPNFIERLREQGFEPIIVSFLSHEDDFPLDVKRIFIPQVARIDEFPNFRFYGDESSEIIRAFFECEERANVFKSLLEVYASNFAWQNDMRFDEVPSESPKYAQYTRNGLIYVHYLLSIIEGIRPYFIIVNNDTHPLHLLARLCADQLGIFVIHSERSPTFNQWFEPKGFYDNSEISIFMSDSRWRQAGIHEQHGRRLIEQLRTAPAGHRALRGGPQAFEKSTTKPRVFLPLDNAISTGWCLPSHPQRQRNYPVLSNPEAAIEHFADLAQRLGVELWVKAHPSVNHKAAFVMKARSDPRVYLVEDGFEEAIATADVVICFLTKTAFTALALDKPVVTVGPNMAAVSGLTYHCKYKEDIETQLRAALTKRDSGANRQKLTARFLGYLDQNYFVANNMDNVGATSLLERLYSQHHAPSPIPLFLKNIDALAPETPATGRGGLLVGPFQRHENRRLDEISVVQKLFKYGLITTKNAQPVMFDVGACEGKAHQWFAKNGWEVHAFEPNPPMYQKMAGALLPGVKLNQFAVSDKSGQVVDFYTSEESIGISSMLAFRETHKATATVETIRLDDYCSTHGIDHIDFLKVDTEGFDFLVLKGLNWATHAPSVVICEFEDNKTRKLNYVFRDLVLFLENLGYQIFVSEWHPITRYGGGEHRWRAMHYWPCELLEVSAWGNLVAFKVQIPSLLIQSVTTLINNLDFSDRLIKAKLKSRTSSVPNSISLSKNSLLDKTTRSTLIIYVNICSIDTDTTLGVWSFAQRLLHRISSNYRFQVIGLVLDPSRIPRGIRSIFDDLIGLPSGAEYKDGVELLLHHFQVPVTKCPYVVITHDLHIWDVPWKYNDIKRKHRDLSKLIGGAAAVITEFPRTYYDLPKVLPNVPNALFLSVSPSMRKPTSTSQDMHAAVTEKYKLQRGAPLVLYPAQLQLHKNHLSLFKAVKQVLRQQPALRVVCCGSEKQEKITNSLREALCELELIGTVFLPGRVSDEELQALYERADLVVSPSLAEGGAYIALEAIEQGKKVAVAAIRPALLHLRLMNAHIPTFDPLDIDCMANTITAALAESHSNTTALATIKSWTWELAASQYAEVLQWVHAGCPSGQIPPFASSEAGISIAARTRI